MKTAALLRVTSFVNFFILKDKSQNFFRVTPGLYRSEFDTSWVCALGIYPKYKNLSLWNTHSINKICKIKCSCYKIRQLRFKEIEFYVVEWIKFIVDDLVFIQKSFKFLSCKNLRTTKPNSILHKIWNLKPDNKFQLPKKIASAKNRSVAHRNKTSKQIDDE